MFLSRIISKDNFWMSGKKRLKVNHLRRSVKAFIVYHLTNVQTNKCEGCYFMAIFSHASLFYEAILQLCAECHGQ